MGTQNKPGDTVPLRAVPQVNAPGMGAGLSIPRHFTRDNFHPFDGVEWEERTAVIKSSEGEILFEQEGVEMPSFWSQMATNVVASKYFFRGLDAAGGEKSLKQLLNRVTKAIMEWGKKDGYFETEADAESFRDELTYILFHQMAAFNSPVWFNVGIEEKPQCSACFINSVEDTMESILSLARTEGLLFKFGSGAGTNFSTLRASKEKLSSGGFASGPVSFMKGYDAFAGVIKSGGKTRRAAKMVILNADHPDIMKFIESKVEEEKKARALIDAGYDGSIRGTAYSSVFFQNANHSVRASDAFMQAVSDDREWRTLSVKDKKVMDAYRAREVMDKLAEAAHICGDPGMQFDTTINKWNTCPESGRINASNPCSEYMFLDDSACNLASLNLMKFRTDDGGFDVEAFKRAVDIMILAQEIVIDNASYPTLKIAENSHRFRPLGLGYANLGALLMSNGIPYDSDAGREYAAAITSIMTGQAYCRSAQIAGKRGAFPGFEENRIPFLEVIKLHGRYAGRIPSENISAELWNESKSVWEKALEMGGKVGFRNAQTTVLAPTGTIAFMMDCDTTGIEPDLALVKYKKLADGGIFKIINKTVQEALRSLGYESDSVSAIVDYISEHDTIEGAPGIKSEHLSVFDCAFRPANGKRFIRHKGHIRMMASVQPFISGAISKTVNVPNEITAKELEEVFMEGWKRGLKSISVYRDGCKLAQPLSTSRTEGGDSEKVKPVRRRLPDERNAITHKFSVAGNEGYITVGMYEDGSPGEIFIVMAKEGSTVSGLMDTIATTTSIALQYGVPLPVLVNKFSHVRFEPSGFTNNRDIPMAKSIIDYIFRWLGSKFPAAMKNGNGNHSIPFPKAKSENGNVTATIEFPDADVIHAQSDAPSCPNCGAIMVRNGTCYSCSECGETNGCS